MDDNKMMLAGGAVVLIVVLLAARGGGKTISNVTGSGDAGVTDSQKLGLFGALAGTAASLDSGKMAADAQMAHDQAATNIADISARFGKYKIDADAATARDAAQTAAAINARNAASQDHSSNNSMWASLAATAATIASFFF